MMMTCKNFASILKIFEALVNLLTLMVLIYF